MVDLSKIHPDFQAIKGRAIPLKGPALKLINGLLAALDVVKRVQFRRVITADTLVGADGHAVPVLIIKPEDLGARSPALVYFHGGAFVLKHGPQHIENCVRYARAAGCCVVFVKYRLAPEHPFPAGFNDCHAALRWTLANAARLGIDASRVAVGGDSAGGAMAASVAQRAAHEDGVRLRGQLLIYPVTDMGDRWPSQTEFSNVPPFKRVPGARLWDVYLGRPLSEDLPPYAAPIRGDLTGLAPAYIETAEFDPLHDEGLAYAKALAEHGVEVSVNDTRGTLHGYDLLVAQSALSRAAIQRRVEFLQARFQSADGVEVSARA